MTEPDKRDEIDKLVDYQMIPGTPGYAKCPVCNEGWHGLSRYSSEKRFDCPGGYEHGEG